jgi:soluble lytic murein transglycosylase
MFKKILLTTTVILAVAGSSYGLSSQQAQFSKQAIKALEKKDYKSYYYLKSKLKGTSVYPYLQYKEISTDPSNFEQATIDNYIQQNKNSYWTGQLKDALATYYAGEDKWQLFNQYYSNDLGISGKCWVMQSEYEQGNKSKALDDYGKLWQNRVYMSSGCNEMQKLWDSSDNKPKDYVVNKAYNLAFANKFSDALWLLNTYVEKNDDYVNYISAWQAATKNPSKLDSFIAKYHKYKYFDKIFVEISKDLVKKDAVAYAKVWDSLKNKRYLNNKAKHECISVIAVSFARSQSPQAKDWLARVDKKYLDTIAWEWLLRVSIYNDNYKGYIKLYNQLPNKSQQEDAWKYWLAYSYKKTNQESKAKPILEELTKEPLEYYSFLASDELGKPYNFGNVSVDKLSVNDSKKLLAEDDIQQAIDLYQIGQYKDSTSLWKYDIRNKLKAKEITQIKDLARLAEENDMYYAAIFNMAVIGQYSDVDMLFPKAFISIVNKNANKYGIDRDLVLSIMRKETLFDVEAGSYAGAKGLMQVTIPTAKFIAKKYKLSLTGGNDMESQIFVPENNIKIGTTNLYFLEKLFKKNLILGIGAYNAGPGNVAKWLTKKEVPAKQWIENIPFGETRHYIRKVLVYMVVYNNFVFKNKKDKISNFLDSNLSDKQSFR